MGLLIVVWILALVLFAVGVWIMCDNLGLVAGWFVSIVGILFLVVATFVVAPYELPTGLPKTSIGNGTYKVAFVYVAGENVNVGVERGVENKNGENERLYLYQFSRSAFDSNAVKTDGKKLSVVESSGFRKLVLE